MYYGDNGTGDSGEGVGEGILGVFYLYDTVEKTAKSRINLAIIAKLTLEFAVFCSVGVFMKSMSQDCNPARI